MSGDWSSPPTFLSDVGGVTVPQKKIFDPAVAHYANGFRLGTPELADESARARWLGVKHEVGSALLHALAQSSIGPVLVLRGSWLLSLWFGDRARDPHDLDFISLPPAEAGSLTSSMIEAIRGSGELVSLGVRGDDIQSSEIWTYERAEGRRLAVPWAEPHGVGVLQIDVTFNEQMDEPVEVLPLDDSTSLQTASVGQSLIWKLEWLLTDMHPQGKDLFDAVLLNDEVPLSAGQWQHAIARVRAGEWYRSSPPTAEDIDVPDSEWSWFCEEYPDLTSGASLPSLRERIAEAIRAVS